MTLRRTIATGLLGVALCTSLSGCASTRAFLSRFLPGHQPAARAELRSAYKISETAPSSSSAADRLYARAAKAIQARDYASALELLQYAKQAAPNDVRVLNALGVVYDKLGRFDLSQRYYNLALVQEPGSPVVESNRRYSSLLQARQLTLASAPEWTAPVAAPEPEPQLVQAPAKPAFTLARGTVQAKRAGPLLVGGALALVNASGGAAQPVQRYLATNGWSVVLATREAAVRPTSEIRYAAAQADVADALSRTLPFKVAMRECAAGCRFELIVGVDGRNALLSEKGKS